MSDVNLKKENTSKEVRGEKIKNLKKLKFIWKYDLKFFEFF